MEQYYNLSLKPKEMSKKEWSSFIDMMFQIATSFTLIAKNYNEFQLLIKDQIPFKCDNASFKALQHIRRKNAHYCMYRCNHDTKLFFKKYSSYTDFENRFEDLVFFKNKKAIYISVSHEVSQLKKYERSY